MAVEKELLRIASITQSAGVAMNSLKLLKKKKRKSSDFLQTGVETIVGSALVKEQSDFIQNF